MVEPYSEEQCKALHQMIADGWTLVDVRTNLEYNNGHIPGAINCTMRELYTLPIDGSYLVYCQTGNRSSIAANALKQHDITCIDVGGIYRLATCFGSVH